MVVNDVRDGTRSPEQIAAFEAFGIGSIVNTPYLSNGRWVFDLGVTRTRPSVWREDEIELLREISARVWIRIERARAEEALRASERRFRTLADTAPALIWQNDARGENVFINQQFLDYTGTSAEEIAGARWRALVHPDDVDAYVASYLEAVAERTPWQKRNR